MFRSHRWVFLVPCLLFFAGCDGDRTASPPASDSPPPSADPALLPATGFTEQEQLRAAQMVVAWIVEDKQIPGVERYPDAEIMKSTNQFIVVCESLPRDVSLSTDPRVQRLTGPEAKAYFDEHDYRDTDYLELKMSPATESRWQVYGSNMFSGLSGHGIHVIFRKENGKLVAEGGTTWVS